MMCGQLRITHQWYPIQHYVVKFVSDIAADWWFSPCTPVSSSTKTDRYDIAEILLKMTLNRITLTITTPIK